jgi:hypothetical protein
MFKYGTVSAQARTVVLVTSIAINAMVWLAACGSVAGGGAGHPATTGGSHTGESTAAMRASAGVPLCAAAGRVDRAVLSLTASQARELLPREITISDAPRVRVLAAALCALPLLPAGAHCTAALDGAVRLIFAADGRGFQPVRIQDSGCPRVTGVGPARQWSWSSFSGRLLSEVVGGKGKLIPGTHPSSVPTP